MGEVTYVQHDDSILGTASTDPNVAGRVELGRENWLDALRRSIGNWLSPLARKSDLLSGSNPTHVKDESEFCWFGNCGMRSLGDCIKPEGNAEGAAVLLAVLDGDLQAATPQGEIGGASAGEGGSSACVLGGISSQGYVRVDPSGKHLRNMKTKQRTAIPVYAGEVVAEARFSLGLLAETPENEMLVRAFVVREISKQCLSGVLPKDLRARDRAIIAQYASGMFFIPTQAELEFYELFKTKSIQQRKKGLRKLLPRPAPQS
jgi:hypothetical protein